MPLVTSPNGKGQSPGSVVDQSGPARVTVFRPLQPVEPLAAPKLADERKRHAVICAGERVVQFVRTFASERGHFFGTPADAMVALGHEIVHEFGGTDRPSPSGMAPRPGEDYPTFLERVERGALTAAMIRAKGNKRRCAHALGLSRTTLFDMLTRLNIHVEKETADPDDD